MNNIRGSSICSGAPMNELYRRDLELLQSYPLLMGVDEAGRGALAGPVVCAAVILDYHEPIPALNDSKQVTAKQRGLLYEAVLAHAQACQIVAIPVKYIDEHNILQATLEGMRQAITAILPQTCLCLVDGNQLPSSDGFRFENTSSVGFQSSASHSPIELRAIVSGDASHACIAAASILAKVTRDRLMIELHDSFPQYGFDRHKGYGTAAHLKALRQQGPCAFHRMSYGPVRDILQVMAIFAP